MAGDCGEEGRGDAACTTEPSRLAVHAARLSYVALKLSRLDGWDLALGAPVTIFVDKYVIAHHADAAVPLR